MHNAIMAIGGGWGFFPKKGFGMCPTSTFFREKKWGKWLAISSACYSKTAVFWVLRVQDRTGGLNWTHNAVSGAEC